MKVRIDRPACIGAANCIAVAPHLFHLDRDNKAVVAQTAAEEADEEILWEAADGCPALAIILEDDDGHQIYPQ